MAPLQLLCTEGIFKSTRFERRWPVSDQIFYVSTKIELSSSKFELLRYNFMS